MSFVNLAPERPIPLPSPDLHEPDLQGAPPVQDVEDMDTSASPIELPPRPAQPAGSEAGFAGLAPAARDWQADLPELAEAWRLVARLQDGATLASAFGAIDVRNALLTTLGLSRKEIDTLRADDGDGALRLRVGSEILNLSAQPEITSAALDRPGSIVTLPNLFSMMDSTYAPHLPRLLPPVLTLLILRQQGHGAHYDAAVLARHQPAFQEHAGLRAEGDQKHHDATQGQRTGFLADCAGAQERWRALRPAVAPVDDGHLPEPVQHALGLLADAYRLNMTLAQKSDLSDALAQATETRPEPSPDVAATLEQLLRWHEAWRPGSLPPPLEHLLAIIPAVGWNGFQDEKSLRERIFILPALTGHAALPDALCAALRYYLPKRPVPNDPALVHAMDGLSLDDPANMSLYQRLQRRLEDVEAPGPFALARVIEATLAATGPALVERMHHDPQAATAITGELLAEAADAAKQARIEQAMATLSELTRSVVMNNNPLRQALALALYRTLGEPAAQGRRRLLLLQRVFLEHQALGPREVQVRVAHFANRMVGHGYDTGQSAALCQTALDLVKHWDSTTQAKNKLEKLHDRALERTLERQIEVAGTCTVEQPARLTDATPQQMLASLRDQHGFTGPMLVKLMEDLGNYFVRADVDERRRLDELYAPVLHPANGSLEGQQETQAVQGLIGALYEAQKAGPPHIGEDIAKALDRFSGTHASLEEVSDLLFYFWRLPPSRALSSAAVAAVEVLERLKAARCVLPLQEGQQAPQLDLGMLVTFNNAVREHLAKLLSDRVEGFGAAYTSALENLTEAGYQENLAGMQQMLNEWTATGQSY